MCQLYAMKKEAKWLFLIPDSNAQMKNTEHLIQLE